MSGDVACGQVPNGLRPTGLPCYIQAPGPLTTLRINIGSMTGPTPYVHSPALLVRL